MLFPASFISESEKLGVGLEKQTAIFYFNFTRRWVVEYSCFDFYSSAKWRYFQLSGLWNTYLTYQIRRTATYVYVEIRKMLNFLSICSRDWNICVEYDLRGQSRCVLQYVLFDMLNRYFTSQIAENTFFCTGKKVKTGILDYPSPGEIEIKQEFRGRHHRTCWGKSHRSHNQNVIIK